MVFEDNGARMATQAGAVPEQIRQALTAYLRRPHGPRRVTVQHWNGRPVFASDGQPLLQAAGFKNTPSGMEWWAGTDSP
jgi:hypothetical protein